MCGIGSELTAKLVGNGGGGGDVIGGGGGGGGHVIVGDGVDVE